MIIIIIIIFLIHAKHSPPITQESGSIVLLFGEGDALKPLAKYYENKKENNKFSITPPLAENVQLREGLGCHEITWTSQGG